jgi:hypothetical protein
MGAHIGTGAPFFFAGVNCISEKYFKYISAVC